MPKMLPMTTGMRIDCLGGGVEPSSKTTSMPSVSVRFANSPGFASVQIVPFRFMCLYCHPEAGVAVTDSVLPSSYVLGWFPTAGFVVPWPTTDMVTLL